MELGRLTLSGIFFIASIFIFMGHSPVEAGNVSGSMERHSVSANHLLREDLGAYNENLGSSSLAGQFKESEHMLREDLGAYHEVQEIIQKAPENTEIKEAVVDDTSEVENAMEIEMEMELEEELAMSASQVAELENRLSVVNFETGEWELDSESMDVLARNSNLLEDTSNITVNIEGHADARGTSEFNDRLARKRAESVRSYLVAKGFSENNVNVVSFGESIPMVDGDDNDSLKKNRRVSFSLETSLQ